MKILLLILGIISFSPPAQQRSTPVDPTARNLAWIEVALAVDVEDSARAKSYAEKISDDTLKADAISFMLFRSALAQVKKKNSRRPLNWRRRSRIFRVERINSECAGQTQNDLDSLASVVQSPESEQSSGLANRAFRKVNVRRFQNRRHKNDGNHHS